MPSVMQEEKACPSGPAICEMAEGTADPWLSFQLLQHAASCPECAELLRKLNRFQSASMPAADFEWSQAEKRLQNWMAGVLESHDRAKAPAPESASPQLRTSRWNLFQRPRMALGLVALTVALTSLFWFGVQQGTHSRPQQATSSRPQQPEMPQASVNRDQPPPISPAQNSQESSRPQTREKLTTASGRKLAVKPRKPSPENKDENRVAATPVASAPDRTGNDTVAETSTEPKIPASSPSGNNNSTSVSSASIAAPRTPTSSSHTAFGTKAVFSPGFGRMAASAAPHRPPVSVMLRSGTRLWIVLASTTQDDTGSFTFTGSLLEPVVEGNITVLDSGVVVHGTASTHEGHTSVQINQLVNKGVPYRASSVLQNGTNAPHGIGPAVNFDQGKVFEMWLSGDVMFVRESQSGISK